MKNLLLLCFVAAGWMMPSAVSAETFDATFDSSRRYSQLVIDSRLGDFYANTKQRGLNVYDAAGNKTASSAGTLEFDYVPGLVAKAVIEAAVYYKDIDCGKAWFYSVEDYANACSAGVPTSGGSLDDLNATKMYFGVHSLASGAFSGICNSSTVANAKVAMGKARDGLAAHNSKYSISASTLESAAGGWWHKKSYDNQMWLDGLYMGPALLAELENCGYSINKESKDDWDLITKQFRITWEKLWDKDKELLYHAFAAVPGASTAKCWADPVTLHNKEFWGRAEGWYFLALIDVLEQMQIAGLQESDNYRLLRGYVNDIARGLARYQDAKTGCWYQLLQYDGSFYADRYQGRSYARTYNYLESSATAIFIASYLKGERLELFDNSYMDVASKAYRGFVENFMVDDGSGKGTVHLINCCRSAGLGASANRDGSAEYYLLGSDVTRTTKEMKQTEGKVFGAFILAATEYERAFIDVKPSPVHCLRNRAENNVKVKKNANGDTAAYDLLGRVATAHTNVVVFKP